MNHTSVNTQVYEFEWYVLKLCDKHALGVSWPRLLFTFAHASRRTKRRKVFKFGSTVQTVYNKMQFCIQIGLISFFFFFCSETMSLMTKCHLFEKPYIEYLAHVLVIISYTICVHLSKQFQYNWSNQKPNRNQVTKLKTVWRVRPEFCRLFAMTISFLSLSSRSDIYIVYLHYLRNGSVSSRYKIWFTFTSWVIVTDPGN